MISSDDEDSVPLVKRAIEAKSSECRVRDWVRLLVSLGLILCGVTCITLIIVLKEKVKDEYGVVLDAGSTHTNMFVYKWKVSDIIKGTALVKQIGNCTVTDKDGLVKGISSYRNPEDVGQSLQSCIKSTAKKLIPSYEQDKSPIYLGATAGMRLLNKTNSAAANQILHSVRQTLKSSPFMFEDHYARIISGKEEGLSSWITVNYLNEALDYSKEKSQDQNSATMNGNTVGALDMGGASTQITFVPTKPAENSNKLTLYGKEYEVYTHSFLCYGLKEAQIKFLAQLVKATDVNSPAIIANPCAPRGYHKNVKSKDLWGSPCVKRSNKTDTSYNMTGTGNDSLCATEVGKLFNFTSCRGNKSCTFNGVYLPPTDGISFLAFSGYYAVIKDLNLTKNASLDELKAAAMNVCRKSWDEIKGIPSKNPDILANYCFDAQYIHTILSSGYHFSGTKAPLRFISSINHLSLGWALGFMINATNLLPLLPPKSVPISHIQGDVFLAVVIVGALLVSAGLLLCIMSAGRVYKRRQLNVRGLVL